MSKRDHGLLEAAGLSIADAAKLFQRSRQAIYTGLSHSRDYFTSENAMAILHDAKRNDSSRIEALMSFIASNYPRAESDLILFDQVGYEQASRVVGDADQVMIACNGNMAHLDPLAPFARLLRGLVEAKRDFFFLVPNEWVIGCLEQNLKLHVPSFRESEEISYLPSFVCAVKGDMHRAFVFLRTSVDEMHATEALRLWTHFVPMFAENGERRVRESA